jgi:hypothetical protein
MLNYHICPFGTTLSRISFPKCRVLHGVENLLESVGVVTRASSKKLVPRCFFVSQRQGKMGKQTTLHIGQLVKAVFDKSGMSVAEFARQINCERTNVYTIFRRRTIDVELLVRISYILNHNFLDDVMQLTGLRAKFSPSLNLNISFDNRTAEESKKVMKQLENLVANLAVCEK